MNSRNLPETRELIIDNQYWQLVKFTCWKFGDTCQRFWLTIVKSLQLIPHYIRKRPKDFLNCAGLYVLIAVAAKFLQGRQFDAHVIVTSALVGGFISPFVIPWVRAFPLTGDPSLKGWRRLIDFACNVLAHFLSLTTFVWLLKAGVAAVGSYFFHQSWQVPALFEAGLAFVLVNNFRKVATEFLGIRLFVFWHPQGQEDVALVSAQNPHLNKEQSQLAAWNNWREVGSGYAFWRSTRAKPIGMQYWIALSKIIDSIAILF